MRQLISCRKGTSRNSVVIHKVTRHNNPSDILNNTCYVIHVGIEGQTFINYSQ